MSLLKTFSELSGEPPTIETWLLWLNDDPRFITHFETADRSVPARLYDRYCEEVIRASNFFLRDDDEDLFYCAMRRLAAHLREEDIEPKLLPFLIAEERFCRLTSKRGALAAIAISLSAAPPSRAFPALEQKLISMMTALLHPELLSLSPVTVALTVQVFEALVLCENPQGQKSIELLRELLTGCPRVTKLLASKYNLLQTCQDRWNTKDPEDPRTKRLVSALAYIHGISKAEIP